MNVLADIIHFKENASLVIRIFAKIAQFLLQIALHVEMDFC
jgi:hypothetical protein